MNYHALAWVGIAIFVYSLSVRQLQRAELTGPMWFVLIGISLALGFDQTLLLNQLDREIWQPLVELTLAIFLFSDAAKTRLRVLMESVHLPLLLLLVGLPLTVVFATVMAHFSLGLSWLAAALLAIIIAPTDAALCRGFITAKQVPANLREAINVESGLNDGLCVPLFLLAMSAFNNPEELSGASLLAVFVREIGIAVLVAVTFTALAIFLISKAKERHLFAQSTSPFLFVGFAITVYALTQGLHGSGFIAAFVSGLLFDKFYHDAFKDQLIEEGENIAELASVLIWILFGFISVSTIMSLSWETVFYALCAVTLLRIVPVVLALYFSRESWKSKLTLAWFGPRGMASVVFTMMLLELEQPEVQTISQVAVCTILLSVFLHGLTTRPISLSFSNKS
ncbi:cation:proton antiporter [Pseudoalteromonas xiamenensis]|uniref:Cation:proton antiporter n=1 Tax=Pseudoalteromonas xiamenensis TaxID=882626 RepID=A0A975DK67_9GAMM|nr:cation:proton antiporter [Pseudoalteromonas xiamenensis]QTH72620.1 cation:proton antiporter [Pseudoalteromonas xiamenensis]